MLPELSKLFFHFIFEEKPKQTAQLLTVLTFLISIFLFSFYFRVCTGYANGAYIKCSTKFLSGIALIHVSGDYTPGIYADGYIVFVFTFVRLYVRSFVRTSVTFVEFASKFCVKVSQAVYISATTYQKAFIFGP